MGLSITSGLLPVTCCNCLCGFLHSCGSYKLRGFFSVLIFSDFTFFQFFIYTQILTCAQRERERERERQRERERERERKRERARHVGTPQDPPKHQPPGLLSDPPTHMPLCTTALPSNTTEIHCPKNTAGVKGIPNFGVTPVCPKEGRHACLGLSEGGDRG